jgi:A nuclease family of the HNH/ENDO VII superfamily with conserved AHH
LPIKFKNLFLRTILGGCVLISTNTLFILSSYSQSTPQVSPPPYPPACGSTLTDPEKTSARSKLVKNTPAPTLAYPVASQAHHIFPLELFNTPLGKDLCNLGINLLDGAENGIWLPSQDYPNRTATLHRGSNSQAYKDTVTTELAAAKTRPQAVQILTKLKSQLNAGTLIINKAQ